MSHPLDPRHEFPNGSVMGDHGPSLHSGIGCETVPGGSVHPCFGQTAFPPQVPGPHARPSHVHTVPLSPGPQGAGHPISPGPQGAGHPISTGPPSPFPQQPNQPRTFDGRSTLLFPGTLDPSPIDQPNVPRLDHPHPKTPPMGMDAPIIFGSGSEHHPSIPLDGPIIFGPGPQFNPEIVCAPHLSHSSSRLQEVGPILRPEDPVPAPHLRHPSSRSQEGGPVPRPEDPVPAPHVPLPPSRTQEGGHVPRPEIVRAPHVPLPPSRKQEGGPVSRPESPMRAPHVPLPPSRKQEGGPVSRPESPLRHPGHNPQYTARIQEGGPVSRPESPLRHPGHNPQYTARIQEENQRKDIQYGPPRTPLREDTTINEPKYPPKTPLRGEGSKTPLRDNTNKNEIKYDSKTEEEINNNVSVPKGRMKAPSWNNLPLPIPKNNSSDSQHGENKKIIPREPISKNGPKKKPGDQSDQEPNSAPRKVPTSPYHKPPSPKSPYHKPPSPQRDLMYGKHSQNIHSYIPGTGNEVSPNGSVQVKTGNNMLGHPVKVSASSPSVPTHPHITGVLPNEMDGCAGSIVMGHPTKASISNPPVPAPPVTGVLPKGHAKASVSNPPIQTHPPHRTGVLSNEMDARGSRLGHNVPHLGSPRPLQSPHPGEKSIPSGQSMHPGQLSPEVHSHPKHTINHLGGSITSKIPFHPGLHHIDPSPDEEDASPFDESQLRVGFFSSHNPFSSAVPEQSHPLDRNNTHYPSHGREAQQSFLGEGYPSHSPRHMTPETVMQHGPVAAANSPPVNLATNAGVPTGPPNIVPSVQAPQNITPLVQASQSTPSMQVPQSTSPLVQGSQSNIPLVQGPSNITPLVQISQNTILPSSVNKIIVSEQILQEAVISISSDETSDGTSSEEERVIKPNPKKSGKNKNSRPKKIIPKKQNKKISQKEKSSSTVTPSSGTIASPHQSPHSQQSGGGDDKIGRKSPHSLRSNQSAQSSIPKKQTETMHNGIDEKQAETIELSSSSINESIPHSNQVKIEIESDNIINPNLLPQMEALLLVQVKKSMETLSPTTQERFLTEMEPRLLYALSALDQVHKLVSEKEARNKANGYKDSDVPERPLIQTNLHVSDATPQWMVALLNTLQKENTDPEVSDLVQDPADSIPSQASNEKITEPFSQASDSIEYILDDDPTGSTVSRSSHPRLKRFQSPIKKKDKKDNNEDILQNIKKEDDTEKQKKVDGYDEENDKKDDSGEKQSQSNSRSHSLSKNQLSPQSIQSPGSLLQQSSSPQLNTTSRRSFLKKKPSHPFVLGSSDSEPSLSFYGNDPLSTFFPPGSISKDKTISDHSILSYTPNSPSILFLPGSTPTETTGIPDYPLSSYTPSSPSQQTVPSLDVPDISLQESEEYKKELPAPKKKRAKRVTGDPNDPNRIISPGRKKRIKNNRLLQNEIPEGDHVPTPESEGIDTELNSSKRKSSTRLKIDGDGIEDCTIEGKRSRPKKNDDDKKNPIRFTPGLEQTFQFKMENPKRPGSASHTRYELYKTTTSYANFIEVGGRVSDFRHDIIKGFCTMDDGSNPFPQMEIDKKTHSTASTEDKTNNIIHDKEKVKSEYDDEVKNSTEDKMNNIIHNIEKNNDINCKDDPYNKNEYQKNNKSSIDINIDSKDDPYNKDECQKNSESTIDTTDLKDKNNDNKQNNTIQNIQKLQEEHLNHLNDDVDLEPSYSISLSV